jgi:hypothetical protein
MNAALTAGVDVVGIARPMVVQPDLPKRILGGSWSNFDPGTLVKLEGMQRGSTFVRGAANVMWHTEQLRRMARGGEPDLDTSPTVSLARMLAAQAIASTMRKLSA